MDTVLLSQNKNLQHLATNKKINTTTKKTKKELSMTVSPQTGDPQKTAEALLEEGPGVIRSSTHPG